MDDKKLVNMSPSYKRDIENAARILKEAGCREVFLFGSLAEGTSRKGSDIDLAVRGCPPERFFHVFGRLLLELENPVDLIDLDRGDDFSRRLLREEIMVYVS